MRSFLSVTRSSLARSRRLPSLALRQPTARATAHRLIGIKRQKSEAVTTRHGQPTDDAISSSGESSVRLETSWLSPPQVQKML